MKIQCWKSVGLALSIGMIVASTPSHSQAELKEKEGLPKYSSDGKLLLPKGFHRWIFLGAPITPNGLNGGAAAFPEFHNVYVPAWAYDAYKKTGTFPEQTVVVKELVLVSHSDHPDGSADAPSGRGYFEGEFNGADVMVKDSKRYPETNGWGYFNFGHHKLPYEVNAVVRSKAECAICHISNASKTDYVYTQHYPVLRADQ